MENSPITGFKGMMSDIFGFLKMAFSTKKGLAVVAVCTFVYFLSLFILGGVKIWGLILAILAILAFFVLSWLIWFRSGGDSGEKDE
jgi:hypothetical protein